MPKTCAKCGIEIPARKKFCCNSCKYWYNSIKKDNEKHLPPFKKRNKGYCYVYISVGNTISRRGQGRRSNGMIKGSMSANVQYEVCEIKPFTFESIRLHFSAKHGSPYVPSLITLGDQSRMTKDDAETYLTNLDTAMFVAH